MLSGGLVEQDVSADGNKSPRTTSEPIPPLLLHTCTGISERFKVSGLRSGHVETNDDSHNRRRLADSGCVRRKHP